MAKELKNLLINRIHDRVLADALRTHASGRLIDIGCGTKPYAALTRPFVTEHVGVDHEGTIHAQNNIDLFGSAYSIPAAAESFDTALCTAVLEHLEEPEQALRECSRVLKTGATSVCDHSFALLRVLDCIITVSSWRGPLFRRAAHSVFFVGQP